MCVGIYIVLCLLFTVHNFNKFKYIFIKRLKIAFGDWPNLE